MAIFMSFALILLGVTGVTGGVGAGGGILGGPGEGVITNTASAEEPPFFVVEHPSSLIGQPTVDNMGETGFSPYFTRGYEDGGPFVASLETAIGTSEDHTANVISYEVKRGDTIPKIAKAFEISQETLLGANPWIKGKTLRAGQNLTILLVSGTIHQLKDGETPESVASLYTISIGDLQATNTGVDFNKAGMGTLLIIPGAQSVISQNGQTKEATLPDLGGYFKMPTEGFNWGKLHARNAVDIANACGTPVVASAEGLVVPGEFCDGNIGWNGGYGECITIEHPNGTKTRYAHLSKTSVSIGDYVAQGKAIGAMGDSGETTGCHVHFEVEGAKNPFAK